MGLSEITKEVFEGYVPAAQMPERNTSVFDRLQKAFERAYGIIVRETVGPSFVAQAEGDLDTKENIKALTCILAFIQSARSLDLVLTATGFGIVSTNSTAPASQARVEHLLAQMRLNMYERRCELIDTLTHIEGWGSSPCAARCIDTLFWDIRDMRLTTIEKTADNWLWALGKAVEADRLLRMEMGDDMMQRLLVEKRTAGTDSLLATIDSLCVSTMATMISLERNNLPVTRSLTDSIVTILENNADNLPEYKNSRIYQARHHVSKRNKEDDPTFFFM